MKVTAIHHVALIVSDLEKTKEFYVNKLGFQIVREHQRSEKNDVKLDLACGSTELEIFVKIDAPARPNYPEALGLRHLAFKVDDVAQTVLELKAVGIECEPIRLDDYTGLPLTFFYDPDGLPLEIHE